MMDTVERLAQQAAETINGGEFNDGKWYTEGQRQAWRKAMTPAADEIERLREQVAAMQKYHPTNIDYFLHNGVRIEYDLNMLVVFKVEGPK